MKTRAVEGKEQTLGCVFSHESSQLPTNRAAGQQGHICGDGKGSLDLAGPRLDSAPVLNAGRGYVLSSFTGSCAEKQEASESERLYGK